ncbi:MAG: nuclear transport factor 2 family protein [Spirochaetes bacterium]|nr:nuclear transport factor 2 family protein [Spirochaetota bacterium]
MKTTFSVMLLSVLVLLSACAPKVNDPADVQAITQSMNEYFTAVIAGNVPASVAMLTDKTGYYEPHMPAMVGRDAVTKFHQMIFDQFTIEMNAPVVDVRVVGNLAVVRGTYTQKLTPKTEGAAVSDSGNWTVVLQRQADRAWKWDWVMGNSDQPVPGTTADGAEEQALIKIEQDWAAAMVKRDVATLDRILAKEWTENADGDVMSRAETMAALKSGVFQMESVKLRGLSVHSGKKYAALDITGAPAPRF